MSTRTSLARHCLCFSFAHAMAQGGSSGTTDQKYEQAKQKAAEAVRETVGSDPRTSGGQRDMANKAYDAAADTVRHLLVYTPTWLHESHPAAAKLCLSVTYQQRDVPYGYSPVACHCAACHCGGRNMKG